jgi:tRNA(Ile)-lysidine synthase
MHIEKNFKEKASVYLKKNERIGIAVSGGVDSVVLLHLVVVLSTQYSVLSTPIILHLNHQLRGKESDKDEMFVKKLAKQYSLTCVTARKNILALSQKRKKSIEDMGREARVEFFKKAAKKYRFKKVLLAHHRDDLVETVLMRLFRGAGARGLRGMSQQTKRGSLVLIRPLLNLEKKEIQNYSKKRKLKYREDVSNQDDRYFRNKVRLKIIPALEKELGSDVKKKLLGFRSRLMPIQDFVEKQSLEAFKKSWKRIKDGLKISVKTYEKLHPAVQYGALSLAFQKLAGKTLEQKEWDHVQEVIEGKKQKINLRGNCFFVKKNKVYCLTKNPKH